MAIGLVLASVMTPIPPSGSVQAELLAPTGKPLQSGIEPKILEKKDRSGNVLVRLRVIPASLRRYIK